MLMERIRKDYGQMTAVERRIAAVILEDPVGVTNSTLAHLAAQAGVSEGSVVNFASRLGAGGFSALKIALARETHTGFSFGDVTGYAACRASKDSCGRGRGHPANGPGHGRQCPDGSGGTVVVGPSD